MTVEVTGPAEYQTAIMNSMVKRKGDVHETITKNSKNKIRFLIEIIYFRYFHYGS
jgi:translation elongation factor EF-G